jgi:hypothetical protein
MNPALDTSPVPLPRSFGTLALVRPAELPYLLDDLAEEFDARTRTTSHPEPRSGSTPRLSAR